MTQTREIEERHTKEYWIKIFEEYMGTSNYVIKDDEDGWKVVFPKFDTEKAKHEWQEKVKDKMSYGPVMVTQYALICPNCGRWFDNGWYQTECWCGKKIPSHWWYP